MIPANTRIWIVAGMTDMRRGFTNLSGLVDLFRGFCGLAFLRKRSYDCRCNILS
jgi:hypothetical protein